eukprot:m.1186232 g.1186232  ORF g.1186232 m.1186232 type:complete len:276 (+) comp24546_c0_seq23:150-977(+)
MSDSREYNGDCSTERDPRNTRSDEGSSHHRNSRHFSGRMKGSTAKGDRDRPRHRPAPYDVSQRRRAPRIGDRLSHVDASGVNAAKWPHDKIADTKTLAAASAAQTKKETGSNQASRREADPKRLMQRQKQIDFGKNTTGYDLYRKAVPKHARKREHPRTPDKYDACSKRAFAGRILQWRKALHAWDPQGESINEKIGDMPEEVQTNDMNSIDNLLEEFERDKEESTRLKGIDAATANCTQSTAPENSADDFEAELRKAMDDDAMIDFDDELELDL